MDEQQALDMHAVLTEYIPADVDSDCTLQMLAGLGENVQAMCAPFSFSFSCMGFRDGSPFVEFEKQDGEKVRYGHTWENLYDVGSFDLAGMMVVKLADSLGEDITLLCTD